MKRNLKIVTIIILSVFLSLPALVKAQCVGGHVTAIRDTICTGTPGSLTLSGNNPDTIQWQSSIDDSNFADISGATKITYKTVPLQQTTWYRVSLNGGLCFSDTLQLFVPAVVKVYFSATQTGPDQITFNSDSSTGDIRSYQWDFGNGKSSNQQNPVYTYSSDTPYYVCLTLYDGSNCSYTFCRYLTVLPNQNCKLTPQFSFRLDDTTGEAGFYDLSVDSSTGGSITSWSWNFGNGDTSNAQYPVLFFSKNIDSTYNVCLTVKNSLGCTNSICKQLTVTKSLPTCKLYPQFSYSVSPVGYVTFTDLSTDSTGTISFWYWQFDSSINSGLQNPSGRFSNGTHNVCLTTYNSLGCTSQICKQITVNASNPGCKLTSAFSYSADTTEYVSFKDLSTDSTQNNVIITSWNWNFGDGDTSNLQNPQHTFAINDTGYHVCLTVTNSLGCTNQYCQQIIISQKSGQISPVNSIICSGGTKILTVTGATGGNYQWQISPDDTSWSNITGATNTTYTTASADGNRNEFYRMMAQSKVGSNTAEVDISNPVIIITVSDITANSVTLNWTPVGSGNYSVSYSGASSGLLTSVTPPETITGLTANGTYNVSVTQTGIAGCPASGTTVVTTNANCKLNSWFSYNIDSNAVAFTGSAIDSTVGAAITSWHWDFGDGDTTDVENTAHLYALGTYTACLTVTNSLGCNNQYCQQIIINQSSICHLRAQFSYTLNDSSGLASFTDLSTDSTQGTSINSWSWNFNTFNGTSSLQNPSFIFPVDSIYYVCLTVTNSIGCSSNYCKDITFHKIAGPCNITPQFSSTSDATGLGTFHDLSTDLVGTINYWHWNFGDLGSPSDDSYSQNPTHAFTTSSIYNVCLTVGNSLGCDSTICKQVPITSTISSLCVSVFPQDSSLITQTGQQSEEYYLIKEFNTANGDSLALVDTFTVNSSLNTSHCFTNLPNGTYYVKAEFMPGSAQYSNYLPSYYNGVLLWDNATPLNLNGSQFISLMLLKGTNPGGPGFIGGYVSQGANRMEQGASADAFGDPEPGKTVILTSGSGDAVTHTLTDAQGHFQFSNLAYGTYYLAVDELNKPCAPLEVTIEDSTGYHESADFQLNSKSVSSQIVLGIYTVTQHPFAISLAGNPVGDELTLHLQNMPGDAIISITDLLGRKLLTNNAPQQSTLATLNVQSLASGLYLVTVNSGNDVKTIKFVKE